METKKITLDETKLKFKLDAGLRNTFLGMIALGVVSLAIAFTVFGHVDSRHLDHATSLPHHTNMGFSALLVATYFVLGIAVTGVFFTGINHLTGAYWSVGIRRLTETYGMFIPVVGLLLAGVLLGVHDLYEWSHTGITEHDEIIEHKSGFLNTPAFIGRVVFYVILWSVFAYVFFQKSVAQDKNKEVATTKFLAKWSGAHTILFALTFSFGSIDLIMSLTPHWYSTMFGVYCFAAAYQTGLSSYAIALYLLKKRGYYGDAVNENHWHDIGKFLLGMTVFWAYVAFSQFMLIWYAAIPEETFFFEQRFMGGWGYWSLFLPIGKFVIPFFLLLNRPNKRDLTFLAKVGAWVFFMQFVEIFWLVFPANFQDFTPVGFVLALGSTLGTLGLFALFVSKKLETVSLIPLGDPRLEGSLNHRQ